eukprot:285804-Rhodomonas_salina.2
MSGTDIGRLFRALCDVRHWHTGSRAMSYVEVVWGGLICANAVLTYGIVCHALCDVQVWGSQAVKEAEQALADKEERKKRKKEGEGARAEEKEVG